MKGIIGGVSNKKIQNERNKKKKVMQRHTSRRKLNAIQPIDFERDLDIDEVIPPQFQVH